jgi:hypothetical protein
VRRWNSAADEEVKAYGDQSYRAVINRDRPEESACGGHRVVAGESNWSGSRYTKSDWK